MIQPLVAVALALCGQLGGPDLERRLAAEDPKAIAAEARAQGDPVRGARLFHDARLTCVKCHAADGPGNPLGPDLSRIGDEAADAYLVESILNPSKVIKTGYETVTVATKDGQTLTGLIAENRPDALVLRDPAHDGRLVAVAKKEIEAQSQNGPSLMPAGLASNLASRQEFLDLVRYLREIADKGPARALELRPDPSTLAGLTLPAYESNIDHAALIAGLGPKNLKSGEAIYQRVCANCHGTKTAPGSMPTSPRFATGTLKNGSDPFAMYRTLTHGFGQMPPQTWMVPRQKYDVIHYLRETYFKGDNPRYYAPIGRDDLAKLPKGTSRGPEPLKFDNWSVMDYGPSLLATIEVGDGDTNYAYKGIAIRLDPGPGGVSRGKHWAIYDHDTMRLAGAWSGDEFIDWHGINFDGQHETHPRVVGRVEFASPNGLGWADPATARFDDPRPLARDDRRYGPLPRPQLRFRGVYFHAEKTILAYDLGATPVLEMPGLETGAPSAVVTRALNLGPRPNPLILQVARDPDLRVVKGDGTLISFASRIETTREEPPVAFDGATRVTVAHSRALEMTNADYTVSARIKTARGGTILSKTEPGSKWVPDGKALFVRGGRLVFDVGWVGAVESKKKIDDDRWHNVALTYTHRDGGVRLFIDGKLDGQGTLRPKSEPAGHVVQIGFAAPDFPEGKPYFQGAIAEVRFFAEALKPEEIAGAGQPLASWTFGPTTRGSVVRDATGHGHDGTVQAGSKPVAGPLLVSVSPQVPGVEWISTAENDLRLKIPAGVAPLNLTLRLARTESPAAVASLVPALVKTADPIDLAPFTKGGPQRWGTTLTTRIVRGDDRGPFAVDTLTLPDTNPWLCRVRPTGFDFDAEGHRAWLCTWDGDVWEVRGLDHPEGILTWQRVASGLFQPLGLKVVNGKVFVLCRDQIAILRDFNGDGETDFVECFNSDHQVTESFHEFAMDLQTDAAGNFYYAKGARHGKTGVVQQHGTLLRVQSDGSRTDILANGFRAPNGVCVNPDDTFFLTDQEGFWMPKNRINWVRPGRFYGNLWGYTDVTDPSDAAMEPPLCWITNAVDRSPAEIVRVEGTAWGALRGQLLNLSYGYGKVFIVPHEKVGDQLQGGVSELPIRQLPTGLMRGRFHPVDGQLYACGMFAWAGNQQQPGGFYRIRATGKPVFVPVGLAAERRGLAITFSALLDTTAAADVTRYAVKTWSLKRSASYGSDHINERPSRIKSASLRDDGRTVFLEIPDLAPTWCMEIKYAIQGAAGEPVNGSINNTVHELHD